MNPECVTCCTLGKCKLTDAAKVLSHFVCSHYEGVTQPAQVQARCDIVTRFGNAGLTALVLAEVVISGEGE